MTALSDELNPPVDHDKFPTRENCDPANPYEAFWWMFPTLPGLRGASFMMPMPYYALVSKRIDDLGGMVQCPECGHRKEPKLRLVMPKSGTPSMWAGQGTWVPAETPVEHESAIERAVKALSPEDRAVFFRELVRRAESGDLEALIAEYRGGAE